MAASPAHAGDQGSELAGHVRRVGRRHPAPPRPVRRIQQYTVRIGGGNCAVSAYSDDHGQTRHTGEPVGPGADENKTVELSDGTIMLNSRAKPRRLVAFSRDGGQAWTDFRADPALVDPANNGSILRYAPDAAPDDPQAKWLLLSNTADDEIRRNLTVRMSCDDGKTWPIRRTVEEASSAYSTLGHLLGGDIGMLYERSGYQRMTMARFDLAWLNGTCVPVTLTSPPRSRRDRRPPSVSTW
ncbi:sialidase family protein [Micromonospora sp. MH33]|uniref:sialidase family protein n=1 Tax=Micromonospora sp. MH33 TaxID=1945509 RepID=UPI001AEF997F